METCKRSEHGLKRITPAGRDSTFRRYVSECACGWSSALCSTELNARWAHIQHSKEAARQPVTAESEEG